MDLVILQNGENSTIDYVQLQTVMSGLDPNNFVILCLHPQEAHDAFGYLDSEVRVDPQHSVFSRSVASLECNILAESEQVLFRIKKWVSLYSNRLVYVNRF